MAKPNPKGITTPKGFRAAGGACGIKASGKPDLALIVSDRPCAAVGVFTTSQTPSAPVVVAKRHLRSGAAQAIVCNSGIANAATGKVAQINAALMCKLTAEHVGLDKANPRLVLPSSTGVIGHQLPMHKISQGIEKLASRLTRGPGANADAARAIMTTDLVPKQAYRSLRLGRKPGKLVNLAGICKGSGMIAPNMATMLAFITTDAAISSTMLAAALKRAANESFNRISVDQHTSPSDMVLVLANGAADHTAITKPGTDFKRFRDALIDLCQDLAYQIVQDGEGATRVFRVRVTRAKTQKDADRIGKAIVNSPLVKTAVHGGDPNWGRIVTAAGYSGAKVNPDTMSLSVGGADASPPGKQRAKEICVFDRGRPVVVNTAGLRQLKQIMAGKEIVFTINIGLGKAQTEWLGCDLSKQYVTINADYTT